MRFSHSFTRFRVEIDNFFCNIVVLLCILYNYNAVVNGRVIKESHVGHFGHVHRFYPYNGEIIEIHFKTKLTTASDLLRRDFHIIHLQLPNNLHPVDIHLYRNEDLVDSSALGDGHAVFKGDFYPKGSVALTATLLDSGHDDSIGFSGHIIQGNDHFILEPIAQHSSLIQSFHSRRMRRSSTGDNSSTVGNITLPHKLYKMETLLQHDNGTHADVAHVPKDELEKAIEEMNAAQQQPNTTTTTTESSNPAEDNGCELDDDDDDDEQVTEDDTPEQTLAAPNKNNKNKIKTTGKNVKPGKNKIKKPNKPKARNGGAGKAGTTGNKIVEIALFADSKLSKVWQTRYPKDGKTRMRTFMLNLINNMNQLYQQPSLGVSLSFRLVHLEIMPESPAGLDPSGGEATKYLKSFCKYAGNKNEKGNQWDHALLLTGYDLKDNGDKLVAGMAWFSTMCLKYWSCSVSEGSSFSTAFILTHEMGHSLGMEHDGTGVSKSCSANKFIMSPTTGSGKTSWSSCSSANLKDFLTKGSPEVGKKDLAAIPTCLTRPSPLKNQQIRFSSESSKLPGEIYNLQIQCEFDCGDKCKPRISKPEEVCAMLWCEKSTSDGKMVMGAHPALEGSGCGTGMYCKFGKCVKNPNPAG